MILAYYGLRESPFGVTPDPRYLYASPTHREALASLLYGLESGLGFITLTAMPGMGKTTLLFETLSKIKEKAATAFIFQTVTSPAELLKALLFDLGVAQPQGSLMDLQLQLNEVLAKQTAAGKRVVVVIDEAQNLDDEVLEMVRMLSNFERPRAKMMQIILAGQPQLAKKLTEPQLLQLRQRISISARLEPFSAADVAAYIQHRLTVAGYHSDQPLFADAAVELIAQHSGGIPRNINNLCFNALSIGCAMKAFKIGPDVIHEVINDLDIDTNAEALTSVISNKAAEPVHESVVAESFIATRKDKDRYEDHSSSNLIKVAVIVAVVVGAAAFGYVELAHRSRQSAPAPPAAVAAPAPAAVPAPATAATAPAPSTDQSTAPDSTASAAGTGTPAATAIPPGSAQPAAAETQPAPQQDAAPAEAAPDAASTVPAIAAIASPNMPGHWVRAKPRQSLHSICTETFGVCGPARFQAMLQANSSLPDPNIIKPGQKVFVPTGPVSSIEQKEARP